MTKITTVHLLLGEPLARIKELPVRPHAVHHAVMNVEGRITGGSEEVSARVAADHVVAAAVRADFWRVGSAFGKVAVG